MSEQVRRAVVAGHICLDIIPALPAQKSDPVALLEPGALTLVGPAVVSTGGAVANTGLALHRLGVPVRLVGKVGGDPFGAAALSVLRGVDPALADGMIEAEGDTSSYTVVMDRPGSDRSFLHHAGTNDTFTASDVTAAHFEDAAWFHFGYPPLMRAIRADNGAALVDVFRRAKKAGFTTSLDMAYIDPVSDASTVDWRQLLEDVLPYVDVFLPSVNEVLPIVAPDAPAPRDRAGLRALAEAFFSMGVALAGVKLGSAGLYVCGTQDASRWNKAGEGLTHVAANWRGVEYLAPCFAVEAVGATGSGDCTFAGLIAGVLRELAPADVVLAAVGAGACCVERPDATSGIPDWGALSERIADGWAQRESSYARSGFAREAGAPLWRPADV